MTTPESTGPFTGRDLALAAAVGAAVLAVYVRTLAPGLVAIIDTPWNGVWQSMKIAAAAEHFEVNVAPHNFYGHLCTMMNAHFSAAVPNLRIMETDIDRLAWDHELFTHVPEIVDGHLIIPDRPGWGTEPNEEGLRAPPPKSKGGLLNYGQKK